MICPLTLSRWKYGNDILASGSCSNTNGALIITGKSVLSNSWYYSIRLGHRILITSTKGVLNYACDPAINVISDLQSYSGRALQLLLLDDIRRIYFVTSTLAD